MNKLSYRESKMRIVLQSLMKVLFTLDKLDRIKLLKYLFKINHCMTISCKLMSGTVLNECHNNS